MSQAVSADGTVIHYSVVGAGRPIVLVHGALSTGASWLPIADLLSRRFAVFVIDRRGRAPSGSGVTSHTMEREVEDVRAVLAAAGPGAALVGHSYGGTVALETALVAEPSEIESLVVYEPAIRVEGAVDRRLAVKELRRRLRESSDAALSFFAASFSSLRPEEASMLPHPLPVDLLSLLPTVPDELDAVESLPADVERYRGIRTRTLLLIGGVSDAGQEQRLTALRTVLPHASVSRLQGQGHIATLTDPGQVAAAIVDFL